MYNSLSNFTLYLLGNGSDCVHGDIRLQEITNNWPLTTIDICIFGFWEPICGQFWSESDIQFICSYLGFTAISGLHIRATISNTI